MNFAGCLLVLLAVSSTYTTIAASQKGAPEILDPALVYGGESEVINKVQGELMNALDLLQNYQEGANLAPLKLAEKRRNKFEFIRFGRR